MSAPPAGGSVDLLFDARHIRQSGIGTYIATLLPHLEETLARRGRSLAVLANEQTAPSLSGSTMVVLAEPDGAPMYGVAEQKAWRHALQTVRPRAMWVPHYPFPLALLEPRYRPVLAFVTVHDVLHLQKEEISGHSRLRQAYARAMLNLDGRRARRIFSPSQATATALVQAVPSAKVTVTPIPVDESWLAPVDPTLSPVQGRYILYVGNAKYHKNLPLLLDAYADVGESIPQNLVIAGGGEAVRATDGRVGELAAKDKDRVQVLGRLDFEALRALVAGADLLIMPSLFEGAGLPPIEAMATGTGVLCSGIPVLRETCGEGADYFDPYDPAELTSLLRHYCADDDALAALAAKGHAYVLTRQAHISNAASAELVCDELDKS
ncbi:glycosyltransferase family 4 protein [Mycolicibacterium sphagni]|uniref:Glycosyl transferase family 1 n=1 Tax=Mycolicibacterium sphagni TaxID=1786 RepID=A0A255DH10_9MYCO|nr:glycosyltransferase family 1 protein [Mycolicibacterium sphagni]MCV7177138.1 glycosyltransferase family 4 protein [Mycolicibacterium sphagni]OYN78666.1 glycosyl transferase family 1 [Mycolicibacterium sphagni]